MELSISEAVSPLTVPSPNGTENIISNDDPHRFLPHHHQQHFPAVIPPPPPLIQLSSPLLGPGARTAAVAAATAANNATAGTNNSNPQQTGSNVGPKNINVVGGVVNVSNPALNQSPVAATSVTQTTVQTQLAMGAGVLPTVDSIIQTSIHKKPLKDLTTAESILLLDLVCHPNRIPLGTIKYRITGDILNHVKSPQDLAEIGLQFPRIILCSMAEAIVKYQREGVPLEIFPATCSLSSKVALSDFASIGSNNTNIGNGNSVTNSAPSSVSTPATSDVAPNSKVMKGTNTASAAGASASIVTAGISAADSQQEEANQDSQQTKSGNGGGKRIARGNTQDNPSPVAVVPPPPTSSPPPPFTATTAASSVAALKQQNQTPVAGKEKSLSSLPSSSAGDSGILPRTPTPLTPAESTDSTPAAPIPKNILFLHPTLSLMELEVIAKIEQKLIRDGYDIQTRFLPGSGAAAAMNEWMESQSKGNNDQAPLLIGAATLALKQQQMKKETASITTAGSATSLPIKSLAKGGNSGKGNNNATKPTANNEKDATLSEESLMLDSLSAFEFVKYLLSLYCPNQLSSVKKSSNAAVTNLPNDVNSKLLLTMKILLFILSVSKLTLEHSPMQRQSMTQQVSQLLPIRRQDVDIIYDILKMALQIGSNKECLSLLHGSDIGGNSKLELIFDPIIDMATSHHKSFVPSSIPYASTTSSIISSALTTPVTTNESSINSCSGPQTTVSEAEQCCELIGTTKICEVLVQMCKDFYSHVDLCVITCCAINDVTMQRHGFFTEYQDKFYDSGVAPILIRSLFLHKANGTAIQSICCAIIGLIANHPANSRQFRDHGTFEVLVQVLRLHLVDVNVVERILDAMLRVAMIPKLTGKTTDVSSAISTVNTIKPIRFKETGACELIVEVLSLHKTNASVAVTASRIIGIMAKTMEHAIKLGQVGAIEELLEVLKIYISRESIEKYSATALRNLLCFEENKLKIHKIGACELILKIVLLHLNAVTVVEKLIGILLHLSSFTASPIIPSGLASHSTDQVSVGNQASVVPTTTNTGNVANSTAPTTAVSPGITGTPVSNLHSQKLYQQHLMKLGENGICLILVELLKEHKKEASIVRQACHTLKYIATIAENQRRLVDHNLFAVLVEVLSFHGNNAVIVSRVCDVLNFIAIIPKALTLGSSAGGTSGSGGSTISKYIPEKREVFIRHVPTRFVHLLTHIAPPNPIPVSSNNHHHNTASNSVGGSGSTQATPTPSANRVITNRHYFCNTISVKKNQTMLPFTEVAIIGGVAKNGNDGSDALHSSNILAHLQECLVIHQENVKLEKKIRQTFMLMSCLA